jgi:hypothetical protein
VRGVADERAISAYVGLNLAARVDGLAAFSEEFLIPWDLCELRLGLDKHVLCVG